MSKCLLFLVFTLFCFSQLTAQNSKDLKLDTVRYLKKHNVPEKDAELILNLTHPSVRYYSGNELYDLYYQDRTLIDRKNIKCFLGNCPSLLRASPESSISESDDGTPKMPFILKPFEKLKAGKYYLSIRDSTGMPMHIWEIVLLGAKPSITNIKVEENGQLIDYLPINENYDLSDIRVTLEGEYLDQKFENVSIQKLDLKKNSDGTYTPSDNWTKENLKKISLENSSLVVKRFNTDDDSRRVLRLDAPKPKIETNSPIKISPGTDSFKFMLRVSNVFKDTKIMIEDIDGGSILRLKGLFSIKRSEDDNDNIEVEVKLKEGSLALGNARIRATLINGDGKSSDTKIIVFNVEGQFVTVNAYDEINFPLLEGMSMQVAFRRVNGNAFSIDQPFFLTINGDRRQLEIENDYDRANLIIAKIALPEGSGGKPLSFRLNDNDNSWNGNFPKILRIPKVTLDEETDIIRPKETLHLSSNGQLPEVDVSIKNKPDGISLSSYDFSNGMIELSADGSVDTDKVFDLQFRRSSYLIDSIRLRVESWEAPEKALKVLYGSSVLSLNDKKIEDVDERGKLIVENVDDLDGISLFDYSVSVTKNDGSTGTKKNLIRNKESGKYNQEINFRAEGLRGGSEFTLTLASPRGVTFNQPFYVKRRFIERWIAQAGLSAINHYTIDRPTKFSSRTNVLSGVNLGFYYLPEWQKREGTRVIGFGLNIIGQQGSIIFDELTGLREEQEAAGLRLGLGVILFETLSLGYAMGDNLPGSIYVGANITFLDFSSLVNVKSTSN